MEPLKRSVSKLKPPSTITRTNSSSAISTALAVAAALEGATNENYGPSFTRNNNELDIDTTRDQTLTLDMISPVSSIAGTKRKAEEAATNKRPRKEPVPTTTTARGAMTIRAAPARKPVAAATNATTTAATKRPVPRPNQAAASTSRKPTPTSRPPLTSTSTATRRATAARPGPTIATPTATAVRGARVTTSTAAPRRTAPPPPSRRAAAPTPTSSRSSTADTTISQSADNTASLNVPDLPSALELSKKKKRPVWDTKGRLQDMEEITSALQQLLQSNASKMTNMTSTLESDAEKISELEAFRLSLESKVVVKENENQDILRKMQVVEHNLQIEARKHDEAIQSLKSRHLIELDQLKLTQGRLQQEMDLIESRLKNTSAQLEQQMTENISLRSTISVQSSNCLAFESDNRALKMRIERTEDTVMKRELTIEELERRLCSSETLVKELEQKLRDEESVRRQLHNTILELKGNIRVFCRVRPTSPSELTKVVSIQYPDYESQEIELAQPTATTTGGSKTEKMYPFKFDKIFQPSCSQADVFGEISQLAQSALDGYNVCIFAYGQTGSGKTFTMEGPPTGAEESAGMIPRSVLQIYEHTKALEAKGWAYSMEGQYVEIYNETIIDLLSSDNLDDKKHEIKHAGGRTTITDVMTMNLTSADKVASFLKTAAHNRSVGATLMNERSSRSHCVFTLRLSGTNSTTGESSEGTLNLIDLAGSERLSQSGATGDRLKETVAINKSLSTLGDVIYAIANKDQHIPYRNSKLTYLLQNSLGGNSKTLMFVNISPLQDHLNETLCSLRFATKVNACTIGTATKRRKP